MYVCVVPFMPDNGLNNRVEAGTVVDATENALIDDGYILHYRNKEQQRVVIGVSGVTLRTCFERLEGDDGD